MQSKFFIVLLCLSLISLCTQVNAERPAHCLEPHPKGVGICAMLMFGFYYNPTSNKCEQWNEGGCKTEGGHSYISLEECEADCLTE